MKLKRWRVALATVAALSFAAFGIAAGSLATGGEATPEPDQYGVIGSASWAEAYPLQYASYLLNAQNVPPEYDQFIAEGGIDETSVGTEALEGDFSAAAEKANYLADDQAPEIKTIGKGYGYAKYYTEPAGHVYSLWSISHNGRLGDLAQSKGKISCFACKTPQIHFDAAAAIEAGQTDFWLQPISEHATDYNENISCANCHVNEAPGELAVLRADWRRAMGDDLEDNINGAVCGQCHCDYSMAPAEPIEGAPFLPGEPTSPYYGGIESMNPVDALAFYDEYGFCDYTYASTGAKMLAVRHAEFEFNYGPTPTFMTGTLGYDCSDCHMGTAVAEDGTEYTSHHWMSPLDNEAMLEECNVCHQDLTAEIKAIQEDIDGRTHILGLRLEQFIFNFQDVVAIEDADGNLVFDMDTALANGLTEDQVAQLQKIQREAGYYWNFAAAENSEGAHNPDLYEQLLEQGNALLDEGDEILGVSSVIEA